MSDARPTAVAGGHHLRSSRRPATDAGPRRVRMKAVIILLVGVLSGGLAEAAGPEVNPVGRDMGAMHGRVVDLTDQILPGATVDVEPRGLRLTTDHDGRFTASNLPAGTYELKISYVGFKVDQEEVKVAAGADVAVEAKLQPQAAETVTVT